MPRRKWRPPSTEVLATHFVNYPCPIECAVRDPLINQLFGVLTYDLDNEFRSNGSQVPLSQQMVNAQKLRQLIAQFLDNLSIAVREKHLEPWADVQVEYSKDPATFVGLALGCLVDLCFNLEYVRRVTDHRWAYCSEHGRARAFYPYLGVCPQCILTVERTHQAALGKPADVSVDAEAEAEVRRRYFGNKIQSHHVGRIGERILVFIIDVLTRSHDAKAITGLVYDDQHEVDAVVFFDGIATLLQIKASPLVLLPLLVELAAPMTGPVSPDTGLPLPMASHTFTDIPTAEHDLFLYVSLTDQAIPLGPKVGDNWPYTPFLDQLNVDLTLDLLDNWIKVFRAFEVPKVKRKGIEVKRAYLTSGWGSPIDDNKTKAGLARSDNMMKGTYASLKYGAYYTQECLRRTMRSALVANIDPAHQYAEYLQKLEDIKWGHEGNFQDVAPSTPDEPRRQMIDADKLTYLFDSVFTCNRQILNDDSLRRAWNLRDFAEKLFSGALSQTLQEWRKISNVE